MDLPRGQVLVVDDDAAMRELLCAWLSSAGLSALAVGRVEEALAILEGYAADALLLDLELPDRPGLELLRLVRGRLPRLPVVVLTVHREAEIAFECMKTGAYDYLVKPVDEPRLVTTVANALRHGRLVETLGAVEHPAQGAGSVAQTPLTADAIRLSRMAGTDLPVLIRGGAEADREFVARALHDGSARNGAPFAVVRCGTLNPERLVALLFGPDADETPAVRRAAGGTLLLDAVEELSPTAQGRFLEAVLASARARAGSGPGPEFRILTGTRVDLASHVRAGAFRADLFMRLAVEEVVLGAPAAARSAGDSLRLADIERTAILDALTHSAGNRAESPRAPGFSRTTLHRKLKDHGI